MIWNDFWLYDKYQESSAYSSAELHIFWFCVVSVILVQNYKFEEYFGDHVIFRKTKKKNEK